MLSSRTDTSSIHEVTVHLQAITISLLNYISVVMKSTPLWPLPRSNALIVNLSYTITSLATESVLNRIDVTVRVLNGIIGDINIQIQLKGDNCKMVTLHTSRKDKNKYLSTSDIYLIAVDRWSK